VEAFGEKNMFSNFISRISAFSANQKVRAYYNHGRRKGGRGQDPLDFEI